MDREPFLRFACITFDQGKGSELIRLAGDEEYDDPSPFLRATQVDKCFIFKLWAEGSELLGMMDMSTALAAFFHLSFIMNLQYHKEGSDSGRHSTAGHC